MITAAVLKALPWSWIGAGVAAAALVAVIGVQRLQLAEARAETDKVRVDLASERTGRAQDRAAWADGSRAATDAQREIETLRRQARDRNIESALQNLCNPHECW